MLCDKTNNLKENLQYLLNQVGGNRCELNYRRCETGVSQMLSMINAEMEQIENIQKELNQGAIDLNDIENRFVDLHY